MPLLASLGPAIVERSATELTVRVGSPTAHRSIGQKRTGMGSAASRERGDTWSHPAFDAIERIEVDAAVGRRPPPRSPPSNPSTLASTLVGRRRRERPASSDAHATRDNEPDSKADNDTEIETNDMARRAEQE